jgi:hypothetical protein
MLVYRYSMILDLTTVPVDPTVASAHIGGWSESHWRTDLIDPQVGAFKTLMDKRAACLPKNAAIVGYRVAAFDVRGNKLYPGATSAGRVRFPGIYDNGDIPQMALSLSGSSGTANSSRFNIAAIPDTFVTGGEYNPDSSMVRNVRNFGKSLVDNAWGFLGRDLTQPSQKLLGIAAGVVITDGTQVLFPGTDSLRFNKVRDVNGKPVSGAFFIDASPSANHYHLVGLDNQIVAGPNGSVRRDLIIFAGYTSVTPGRIKVRKIGRPSEQYRGRRSKRRAA